MSLLTRLLNVAPPAVPPAPPNPPDPKPVREEPTPPPAPFWYPRAIRRPLKVKSA
ncbi:hypothetical protein [uncultured Chloroflexus sp.]|uniref:hypothetical protein n=1 Tax=uncultured Chloroflexus sp. TaxID=214040 RepID=UPI0026050AD6|nr:hypothetical protein [uncultured Chloroflexus sp.]